MDSETDDRILRAVADGEEMDYTLWPDLLSRLIPRLEKIAHNDFPALKLPPTPARLLSPVNVQTEATSSSDAPGAVTANSSQSTDKENAPPETQPATIPAEAHTSSLPPQLLALLSSIISTLTTYFTHYPPHTIQRLSELILSPKQHYRTLPSYLHAVDRVVHVTSGANIYPLPAAVPDAYGAKILSNGASTGTDPSTISWGTSVQPQHTLGSDESLGGALLTPIPWLRQQSVNSGSAGSHATELDGEVRTESTETIDGPNGAGSIETVSVSVNGISSITLGSNAGGDNANTNNSLRAEGGVTQGELLRQEQRAGVVPAAQLANTRADGQGEEEETPHARGPDEIGMEDMGPQVAGSVGGGMTHGMRGIDVEAAVGRRAGPPEEVASELEPVTPKREADEDMGSDKKRVKDDSGIEEGTDVDMGLEEADVVVEELVNIDEVKDTSGADSIDTSTV